MKIDIEKIQRYLEEIKARHNEIEELLQRNVDTEILKEPWVMKGLKYALIEIAEAMANILQHILAKDMGNRSLDMLRPLLSRNRSNFY